MPITYQYEADSKIVRAKAPELLTTKALIDFLTSIVKDIEIENGFVEVMDLELVRDLVITYSELSPFPYIWEKYMKKGCEAVVIFAPTAVSYGTFRMVQTAIALEHKIAEELFVIVRSKEELENKLKEILA
jgi:hypothetical protein